VVAGLLVDAQAGTSPIFVLGGLVLGSLTSGIGIWLYARVRRPRPPDIDPEHRP
jgi:F0F1-type ATP synthase assembly protein I